MPSETICKTVRQFSTGPVSVLDMEKLQKISADYCKVKNYVYDRYGGKKGLSIIYPGYTVQNEMTKSGLRQELRLPSVYFYLAVFDALGDIKCQWTRTKSAVSEQVSKNDNLTSEEKHYLRLVLKVNNIFDGVLNEKVPEGLPKDIKRQQDMLAADLDTRKLHRYLCRQVRKCHVKLHTEETFGFAIAERAYRYGDHGIYISTKEKRKRIFVPLTDGNQYASQLYIKLYPEESRIEIKAPINVVVRTHADYTGQIGVSMGIFTMLTTDEGHSYGERLGEYQTSYAQWMRKQTGSYNRNRTDNPGRKKYYAKKKRYEEQLHNYINQELNRFLQTERPETVYIVKLPKPKVGGVNKKINHSVGMWQRGYVRNRLAQKCREHSVKMVEVLGKDVSNECSQCGAVGNRKNGVFTCASCGYQAAEKTNTARNVLKRGRDGRVVNNRQK